MTNPKLNIHTYMNEKYKFELAYQKKFKADFIFTGIKHQ